MIEVLRKSPVLHLGGGKTVTLQNVRPPAKTLSLSAEALVDATAAGQSPSIMDAVDEAEEQSGLKLPLSRKPVAIVFGPENGAVSEQLVYEAASEASAKGYTHLYVIGFAIQPNARELIESCEARGRRAGHLRPGHARPDDGRPAEEHALQPDFQRVRPAGDRRSHRRPVRDGRERRYSVELLGLDVFDPRRWRCCTAAGTTCRPGSSTPTTTASASMSARRSSRAPRRGTTSSGAQGHVRRQRLGSPGRHDRARPSRRASIGQMAVKVIDDRGNELLVVKSLARQRR